MAVGRNLRGPVGSLKTNQLSSSIHNSCWTDSCIFTASIPKQSVLLVLVPDIYANERIDCQLGDQKLFGN